MKEGCDMPSGENTCVRSASFRHESYRAVGHECNVNESTRWYIQKKEEEICRSVLEATAVNAKIKSTVHDGTMGT